MAIVLVAVVQCDRLHLHWLHAVHELIKQLFRWPLELLVYVESSLGFLKRFLVLEDGSLSHQHLI